MVDRQSYVAGLVRRTLAVTVTLALWTALAPAAAQQPAENQFSHALLNNVVQIRAPFPNDITQEGFGFVVGERGNDILIVTANHTVRLGGGAVSSTPLVSFYGGEAGSPYIPSKLLPNTRNDVAVLSVAKPKGYKYIEASMGSAPKDFSPVAFIGQGRVWYVPTISGRVNRTDKSGKIHIDNLQGAMPGSSGAPIVGPGGIEGIILATSGPDTEARSIREIKALFDEWHLPWSLTSSVAGVRPSFPGPIVSVSEPKIDPLLDKSAKSEYRLVGYVLYAQLDKSGVEVAKTWFDNETRPGERFPTPNDILVANRDRVLLRGIPYHWDDTLRAHVAPPSLDVLQKGQKVRVAGGAIIASDENNGAYYVIIPVQEIIGSQRAPVDDYINGAKSNLIGYVYIGTLAGNGVDYSERTFIGNNRFPKPHDRMIAQTDVWLRAGPKRWDQVKREYVNAAQKSQIKQGQSITVGGDIIVAGGGRSLWVPVSEIRN